MRKSSLSSFAMASAIAAITVLPSSAQQSADTADYDVTRIDARSSRQEYRPGEIIVKFSAADAPSLRFSNTRRGIRASSSATGVNALLEKYGATAVDALMPLTGEGSPMRRSKSLNGAIVADSDLSALYVMRFDAAMTADLHTVIEEFSSLPEVEYAEPNYIVHALSSGATDYMSDPLYAQQWGPAAIGLDKLWDVPVTSARRPVIAILDTGVDITHPDLADNIWTNQLEIDGAEGRDDDGNGFTDDLHGWDFVNQSPRMRDNNGHGTHCAGIAAAVGGNGIGITGANPDAYIMPVTILQSNGTGDVATIIRGIDYAVANGADVISMSFGGYYNSIAERDALAKAYQKAVLVAAAGNDALDIYPYHFPGGTMYPAAYTFVLGVEASANAEGARAGFSNFDCDGGVTSAFVDLENYELRAPGVNIMSTFPGGQYKSLNGTSMACPLVAGAISRLMSVKEIDNKEELFGDLIHTAKGNLDIFAAYNMGDADRKPTLSLVTYRLDDVKMGDGDGRADAGETIRFYPTLRNSWGNARNITYSIRTASNEDESILEYVDGNEARFVSDLSSYASIEAESPIVFKVNPDCVDGRNIRLLFTATCDNISEPLEQEIVIRVENGIELGGIIREDMTLYPDQHYIVTSMLAVPQNVTLTIMPGTVLKFKDGTGISVDDGEGVWTEDYDKEGNWIGNHWEYPSGGKIIARGLADKRIVFTKDDLGSGATSEDRVSLGINSIFEYCNFNSIRMRVQGLTNISKSTIQNMLSFNGAGMSNADPEFSQCNVIDNYLGLSSSNYASVTCKITSNCNLIGNSVYTPGNIYEFNYNIQFPSNNSFNNYSDYYSRRYYISTAAISSVGCVVTTDTPSYFGSTREDILREWIWDIKNPFNISGEFGANTFAEIDLSNRLMRPNPLAPGIVWKVVVNDYDAQDEFELLPPLGVGRHKFEVYFSKPMNREKTPMIAMGVRQPYTQTVIAEDGSWRSETMENGDIVDIYTAYLTIRGKDNYDGLNTIYVADAEDEEYFPIPVEDVRYHVNVQSAGSMSSGFVAEAGVGKVTLTWENPEENFDDMLGYNMYRYTLGANNEPGDTIRLNEQLLDTEELVDYDIIPGTTYCYFYKVMRTSLDENSPSKTVAATPRAAGKGDANGSGSVDVADVVTEINYMVGRDPKPFIFDAADVNTDTEIDILDVVGTVNIIMHPESAASLALQEHSAVYSIENGVLYIDSPVELAGVQFTLGGNRATTEIAALDALKPMECTGEWINDSDYKFIAFSMSGKNIGSGRNALLSIGDATVDDIILVDSAGNRVTAVNGNTTGLGAVLMHQMAVPTPNPFTDHIDVPTVIGTSGNHDVTFRLTGISGSTLYSKSMCLGYGNHIVTLATESMVPGFYLLTLEVDGDTVQTAKVIKR